MRSVTTLTEVETMRFMILVKATEDSEAGRFPDEKFMAAMGSFNEQLVKAGVMKAGEGLHPSVRGARVRFSGGETTVVRGPFTASTDLVSGFWLWEAKSMEEAIEWARRAPFQGGEVEIRPLFEAADFAPVDPTGELRAKEAALRATAGAQRP